MDDETMSTTPEYRALVLAKAKYEDAAREEGKARKETDVAAALLSLACGKTREARREMNNASMAVNALTPVDRNARVLTDGSPVTKDHRELKPDGQQKGYIVLTDEERAKGFTRPLRRKYTHAKCGTVTTVQNGAIVETYARDPSFYSGTFCVGCGKHFTFGEPDGDFFWCEDGSKVGE